MSNFEQLLKQLDECVRLSQEMRECVRRERRALIEFKIEDLFLAGGEKEHLLAELTRNRQLARELAAAVARERSSPDFDASLDARETVEWAAKKSGWESEWEQLRQLCEQNKNFYKHSLRNLDSISENLKRLFGMHSTYTAQGTRSDVNPSGNVIKGSY